MVLMQLFVIACTFLRFQPKEITEVQIVLFWSLNGHLKWLNTEATWCQKWGGTSVLLNNIRHYVNMVKIWHENDLSSDWIKSISWQMSSMIPKRFHTNNNYENQFHEKSAIHTYPKLPSGHTKTTFRAIQYICCHFISSLHGKIASCQNRFINQFPTFIIRKINPNQYIYSALVSS